MTRTAVLLIAATALPLPFASISSSAGEDEKAVSCVQLSRIRHTEVIDNRNIAFYMKGGDIYLNQLDHACPNLDNNHAFSYRTPVSRLCSVDVITVLENYGLGLQRGASCGLGMFVPTDEDFIANLKGEIDEDDGAVKVTPVEVKPADAQSTDAQPADAQKTDAQAIEVEPAPADR